MKTNRNELCPCGSSKKFKRCCGKAASSQKSHLPSASSPRPIQTSSSCFLPIDTGVKIKVPDSLELITPYVLREQLHWFEKEFDFVRQLISLGDKVLDIGANYGLYALVIAQKIGTKGHLWAFEPTATTAGYLRASINKNGFNQVTLIQSALSSQPGVAHLALHDNCEMNSLSMTQVAGAQFEEVAVDTLDNCLIEQQWPAIDFIKLDAEGEETRILAGGQTLLSQHSPLIMFEIKHGDQVNSELIQALKSMDYQSYRLVPALSVLVPFTDETLDPYELNLFGCKSDKALKLAHQDRLISVTDASLSIDYAQTKALNADIGEQIHKHFAYSRCLWASPDLINQLGKNVGSEAHLTALQLHRQAHDQTQSISVRFKSLEGAWQIIDQFGDISTNLPRLCTKARLAGELGKRAMEVQYIGQAMNLLQQQTNVQLDEPFLPVCPRFDAIDPGKNLSQWLISSLLEQMELQQSFSSYYSGTKTLNNLEILKKLGFQSEEMERRRQLIRKRFKIN